MNNQDQVQRDSDYRIVALECAVQRGGQDGGLEGSFDVLVIANQYYKWLTGQTDSKEPVLEKSSTLKKR